MSTPPAESESDTNLSPQRRAWADRNLDPEARTLLADDEKYFLRQSVSTPCLNAIVKAEGIWIEDTAGRCYMDFHGNNVHHIGYGHPRLKRAIAQQMDALPFAPRRYTCGPAVALAAKLAEIAPGNLSKVLFTTGGSDAVEVAIKIARTATKRYKTLSFWDAFHGAGFGAAAVGGEALFRSGPVGISSKINSVPWRSQALRTRRQKPGGGICGTARIGSAMKAATSLSRSSTYSIMRAQASALAPMVDVP